MSVLVMEGFEKKLLSLILFVLERRQIQGRKMLDLRIQKNGNEEQQKCPRRGGWGGRRNVI